MKFGVDFEGPSFTKWESCVSGPLLGGPTRFGSSRYDDFMRCPRRFQLAHVKRLTRDEPDMALEVGGAVHECIARAYEADYETAEQGGTDEQCAEAFTKAIHELCNEIQKGGATCAAETRRLLDGWLRFFGPGQQLDWRERTLGIEVELGSDKPFPYTCRVDQIIEDEHDENACWIVDHKTAKRHSDNLVNGYRFNTQFIGQQYCFRASKVQKKYGKLKGTVVSVIVKTNPPQYLRHTVPYNVRLVNRWAKNMRMVWRNLDWCQASGIYPQLMSNCFRFNKYCRFFEYCHTMGKSLKGLRKKEKHEF